VLELKAGLINQLKIHDEMLRHYQQRPMTQDTLSLLQSLLTLYMRFKSLRWIGRVKLTTTTILPARKRRARLPPKTMQACFHWYYSETYHSRCCQESGFDSIAGVFTSDKDGKQIYRCYRRCYSVCHFLRCCSQQRPNHNQKMSRHNNRLL
jgi:hypothetical protein